MKEIANFDITGIQSHMKSGLNGHYLKNRFDTIADSGMKLFNFFIIFDFCDQHFSGHRIWVTEFDIQPYGYEKYGVIDMDFKAEVSFRIFYGLSRKQDILIGFGRFHAASIFSFESRWNHHVEMALESGMVSYQ